MKVVLFCGGLGMRLRPATERIPKPMVTIGEKPLLWHLMKYYSYFGHKDFILCLGYKGEVIKKYFLDEDGCFSNDFILSNGGKERKLIDGDTASWKITFVDTGLRSTIGQRLKAIRKYVEKDEIFLANYSDALTNLSLPKIIDFFAKSGKTGCLVSVKLSQTYHTVTITADGCVKNIRPLVKSNLWLNGGYFIFRNTIFDYIKGKEDLVTGPFNRLIKKRELVAYKYDGLWISMDTFKDKARLDKLASTGKAFWEVWKK